MDLEVVMRSNDCPCIVQFYGAIFKEVRNQLCSNTIIVYSITLYVTMVYTQQYTV